MYHVLIFHHGGQFQLDSAVGGREGEGEENPVFRSLDDLVVFLMAHDLKVEGNEVHFVEAVTCVEENPRPMGSRESSTSVRVLLYTLEKSALISQCKPLLCVVYIAMSKASVVRLSPAVSHCNI